MREERAFASVAEHRQAFDALDAAEPGTQPLNCCVVHRSVAGEGGNGCRDQTAQIDRFHDVSKYELFGSSFREESPLLVSHQAGTTVHALQCKDGRLMPELPNCAFQLY